MQSLIDYGCIVWGNCGKKLLIKIHVIMKRFARSIVYVNDVKHSWDIADVQRTTWESLTYSTDMFTPEDMVRNNDTRGNQANFFMYQDAR